MAKVEEGVAAERSARRAAFIRAAEERGLLGSKDRQLGGRFSDALSTKPSGSAVSARAPTC